MFWPAFGCAQHPKAGRNTQQALVDSLDKLKEVYAFALQTPISLEP